MRNPCDYEFEWGKAVTLHEGHDISIIGTDIRLSACLETDDLLVRKRFSTRLDHCPCLKLFNQEAVISAASCEAIITAEDHSIIDGLGSAADVTF